MAEKKYKGHVIHITEDPFGQVVVFIDNETDSKWALFSEADAKKVIRGEEPKYFDLRIPAVNDFKNHYAQFYPEAKANLKSTYTTGEGRSDEADYDDAPF